MRTYADVVFDRQSDHALHRVRIARVKTSSDVGGAEQRNDLIIHAVANQPGPETFAHVRIQVNLLLYGGCACNRTHSNANSSWTS